MSIMISSLTQDLFRIIVRHFQTYVFLSNCLLKMISKLIAFLSEKGLHLPDLLTAVETTAASGMLV